jgi:hypothetical protein
MPARQCETADATVVLMVGSIREIRRQIMNVVDLQSGLNMMFLFAPMFVIPFETYPFGV